MPENSPLPRESVKNKLNKGVKFQRVQIMSGDSHYEKTKFNTSYIRLMLTKIFDVNLKKKWDHSKIHLIL